MSLKRLLPFLTLLLGLPTTTLAAFSSDPTATTATGNLDSVAGTVGIKGPDIYTFIGKTLAGFIGFLGLIFLILIVYAGILYLTALGEEERIKKSKRLLTWAVIGMLIIVGAFTLTTFVFNRLSAALTPDTRTEKQKKTDNFLKTLEEPIL